MAIVWGKKRVEKRLGHAADFCPICREITPFQIVRVGVSSHVYFIPLGEGNVLGHIGECSRCKTKIPVNPTKYKAFFFAPGTDIEKLIAESYPNLRLDHAERFEIEKKIKEHHIFSPAEREVLLMEPFRYLDGRVAERYANTSFDKESGLGCLLTVLLSFIFGCLFAGILPSGSVQEISFISGGLIFCVGLVYTVVQLMIAPGRFVKREIVPILAKALLPLNPKQNEVTQCVNQLKAARSRLGKKITDQLLWEQIQKERAFNNRPSGTLPSR